MPIGAPITRTPEGAECLRALGMLAEQLATAPVTAAMVKRYGTLRAMVSALRRVPFLRDDGRRGPAGEIEIYCGGHWQRARPYPLRREDRGANCYEKALSFGAFALATQPDLFVRFVEIDTAEGKDVLPMLPDATGQLEPLSLAYGSRQPLEDFPALRPSAFNADSVQVAKDVGKNVLGVVDTVGGAILRGYGLGGVADLLGQTWSNLDAVPEWRKQQLAGGSSTAPRQAAETAVRQAVEPEAPAQEPAPSRPPSVAPQRKTPRAPTARKTTRQKRGRDSGAFALPSFTTTRRT